MPPHLGCPPVPAGTTRSARDPALREAYETAEQRSDSQRFPHAFAAAMNAGAYGLIVPTVGALNRLVAQFKLTA